MKEPNYKELYNLLKEKYDRREKIVVQAYNSLKKKEQELKSINTNLEIKKGELEKTNKKLSSTNYKLNEKNLIIEEKNNVLTQTINQLRETQLQLVQTEKMASLGILTSGIAHEINNPLNFISCGTMALEAAIKDCEEYNIDEIDEILNGINEGIKRASKIILSLNHFSRNTDSTNEFCNIHEILENCLTITRNLWIDNIKVINSFQDFSGHFKGNDGEIHQVFLNIITNAIQAIDKKGTITISTKLHNNEITIEVKDTGKGIKKEYIQRIMDPFFTTKEPGEGTGLGLSISYSIIKKHGGKIKLESKENVGTTVIITLPTNL